jgi:hypothetical protein
VGELGDFSPALGDLSQPWREASRPQFCCIFVFVWASCKEEEVRNSIGSQESAVRGIGEARPARTT